MARPQKDRIVAFNPNVSYFKPRGIPLLELDEVGLTVDEREAIRLADLQGLSHEEAGKRMGVSRATFGRIVQRARYAVADALINGLILERFEDIPAPHTQLELDGHGLEVMEVAENRVKSVRFLPAN